MPELSTYWNGEPARARRCVVVVPAWAEGDPPLAWWRSLAGATRRAVEVEYGGRVFLIDDEGFTATPGMIAFERVRGVNKPAQRGAPGWGWEKVTRGLGSPQCPHASLPDRTVVVAYSDGCEGCGELRHGSHAPGCRIRAGELARSGRFDD